MFKSYVGSSVNPDARAAGKEAAAAIKAGLADMKAAFVYASCDYDIKAAWRGLDKEAMSGGNLLATTITSPLGIKDRLGKLIAIRHPMGGNEDGSMNIGNVLSEKTVVIRMEATVDELIESTGKTFKELIERMPGTPVVSFTVTASPLLTI